MHIDLLNSNQNHLFQAPTRDEFLKFSFCKEKDVNFTKLINNCFEPYILFCNGSSFYDLRFDLNAGQRLVKNLGALFEDVTIEPCLLHGDLWSGNISSDKNGEPVILDPACYCKNSFRFQSSIFNHTLCSISLSYFVNLFS